MLDSSVKDLIKRGDTLFGSRGNWLSFCQDSAENFYPERAHFTSAVNIGEEFASNLSTSYPLMVRRELADAISSMLRRRDTQWGHMTIQRDERLDSSGRAWLDRATKIQWRAMYARPARFVRATKEGDNDFTTFGQTVITHEINWDEIALLYKCWHLRDCAWAENSTGEVNELHIDWKPQLHQLKDTPGFKLHPEAEKLHGQNPFAELKCRRIAVPVEYYDGKIDATPGAPRYIGRKLPYVILYVDCANEHLMLAIGSKTKGFTLPRWQTVSGSHIAYSPAVIAALPDARLIQAMTLTLLEAGEGAVRPPLLGDSNMIRGDANIYPGGITWAQREADEDLRNALQPVFQEKSALPIGLEMNQDTRNQIAMAFYLNKLTLPNPERAGKMTAFEIAERLKEWIRAAIPLFEPIETEYNGALCETTFEELMHVGAFGPVNEIPKSVQGNEVRFRFEGPLHENIDRQKAHTFVEARQLVMDSMDLDPAVSHSYNVRDALHDALLAVGADPKHVRDQKDVEEFAESLQANKQAAELVAVAEGAGVAAEAVGKGKQALQAA